MSVIYNMIFLNSKLADAALSKLLIKSTNIYSKNIQKILYNNIVFCGGNANI